MRLNQAVCYCCLHAVDEAGQYVRRDCACRGTDAGFVHLSCLAEYAETKSMQAIGMNQFIKPWETCPGCHQKYQNKLAIDIATEFVSFVRRQYPKDTQRQVEALDVKLDALMTMFTRLQPVQKREAGDTASVLLSLIDRIKTEASPLPNVIPDLKHLCTTHLVELLSMREQKRVQGERWFTLRANWR
jgi:hypothetical protein